MGPSQNLSLGRLIPELTPWHLGIHADDSNFSIWMNYMSPGYLTVDLWYFYIFYLGFTLSQIISKLVSYFAEKIMTRSLEVNLDFFFLLSWKWERLYF